jgi:hypothetical protein
MFMDIEYVKVQKKLLQYFYNVKLMDQFQI